MTEREQFEKMVQRFWEEGGGWVDVSVGTDGAASIVVRGSEEGSFRLTFDSEGQLVETMGTDI